MSTPQTAREGAIREVDTIKVHFGAVWHVCFFNKALGQHHTWVFTDKDAYKRGRASLEQAEHIELVAWGAACVKD